MESILTRFGKSLDSSKRYTAFTLAEVLITLGIIGIVAAMTIPTLVNKVQKHQYVVALKKFYTTQNNGWAQILADEGVNSLEDTSVFQSMGGTYCSVSDANNSDCKPFFDNLKKYFKFEILTAPSYQFYRLDGSKESDYTNRSVLVLSDGTVIDFGTFYKASYQKGHQAEVVAGGGHMSYGQSWQVIIDVNGFKKPNTWGRDIFQIFLSSDGKVYPYGGKDFSLFNSGDSNDYWRIRSVYCGVPGSTSTAAWGNACFGRIMEEGWEMNY